MVHFPDLFGEIAVSVRELELWLFKVPRLPYYSTRRAAYLRGYNVADKIRAHKAAGRLHEAIPDCLCEFCGQDLSISGTDAIPSNPSKELNLLRRRIAVLEVLLTPGSDQPRAAHSRTDAIKATEPG